MFLVILHTVVQHTVWFSRRDWLTSLPVLPHQLVECLRDATRQLHLVRLLDKHVPLNRFRYMSTAMVCHCVWPEVSILRTLYDEGILSSHIRLCVQTRHTVAYSSPTTLGTNLVGTPDVGAYVLAPPSGVTYHITNSPTPHTVRGFPRTRACGRSDGGMMGCWNTLLSGLQLERPGLRYIVHCWTLWHGYWACTV